MDRIGDNFFSLKFHSFAKSLKFVWSLADKSIRRLEIRTLKTNNNMGRKLKIRDLTMRDGQQSLFATRMNQKSIDKLLPYYKEAGFYAIEVWGGAVPDSVMRYLGENPWDRLKIISNAIEGKSYLTALSRGRNLFGYVPYPGSVIGGFYKNAIKDGLGIMRIFDALNDVNNVKSTVKYVKQYGGIADCAVVFSAAKNRGNNTIKFSLTIILLTKPWLSKKWEQK